MRLAVTPLALAVTCAWGSPARAEDATFAFFFRGSGHVRIHMVLKNRRDRITAVSRLREPSIWRDSIAFPRFDASRGDVAYALGRARAAPSLLSGSSKIPASRYADDARARILEVAGDESDAREVIRDCVCATFAERLKAVALAAYIERRTGHLPNGRVAELSRLGPERWRTAAAAALHAYLYNEIDAHLNDALRHGTPDEAAAAAIASLDIEHPRVLQSMRFAFSRTPVLPDRDAIAAYLVAYGNAGDVQKVESAELGERAAVYLSYMVKDPAELARLIGAAHADWAEAQTLAALQTLSGKDVANQAAEYERVSGEHARIYQSAVVPNRTTAAVFEQRHMRLEKAQWIPWITAAGDNRTLARRFWAGSLSSDEERQLDYLGDAELAGLLRTAKGRQPDWILDVYLAAHRIATRAYYAPLSLYHDGVERRPFVFTDNQRAYSGMLALRPRILGSILRIALNAQLVSDNGLKSQGEVGDVILYSGGRALRAEKDRSLAGGWFSYVLPLDKIAPGGYIPLDRVAPDGYVTVQVGLPSARSVTVVYDVFASDYARQWSIMQRRMDVGDSVARKSRSAGAWERAARMRENLYRFDAAWGRYQLAIASAKDARRYWNEAAHMYAARGMPNEAAAVRYQQVATGQADPMAWNDLLAQLIAAERYADAGEIAKLRLASEADNDQDAALEAQALFLAGHRGDAARLLERHPERATGTTAFLWYVSEVQSKRGSADLARRAAQREQHRQERKKLADAVARCRAETYAGYHYLLLGDRVQAQRHFAAALQTGQSGELAFRMAQVESASFAPGGARQAAVIAIILCVVALGGAVTARYRSFR